MSIEIWKDIQGYEKKYQVSNYGNVRSYDRYDSKNRFVKGIYLKQITERKGYKKVALSKNGIRQDCKVHRLVAQAFILNVKNYTQINHKDEIKDNNNFLNLEWCNNQYNCSYGTRVDRILKSRGQKRNPKVKKDRRKPVIQLDKNNIFIKQWESAKKVYLELYIDNGDIAKCCKSKKQTAGGFHWKYAEIGV